MAVTSVGGPRTNAAIGTSLGDGVTYGAFGQPQRIHEDVTGASAAYAVAANTGSLYTNCFNTISLPTDATINGVELVAATDFDGSGYSYIGNFGSTGSTESATMQMYLYNGTTYSSALTFKSTPSGTSVNAANDEMTFLGGNKRYVNYNASIDLMGGAADSLSGLTWDASSQASWGFAFTCVAVSGTPVYGILRGIGLRITYTEASTGYTHDVNAVAAANIGRLNSVVTAKIGKINNT